MAIRRPPTTFSDTISTADIADDAITTAKVADDQITGALLANDIAISTTGNIATTGSGTLTVAGNTTLSGTNNLGSNPTVTLGTNTTFPGPPSSGTYSAGHVVQVNYTKTDTPYQTTVLSVGSEYQLFYSSNFTTTGTNKVLIDAVVWLGQTNNCGFVLKRGTTVVGQTTQLAGTYLDTSWHAGADNMSNIDQYGLNSERIKFVDSPGAGTHVYRIYLKAKGATGQINFNRPHYSSAYGTGVSSITLMEIIA